MCVEQENWKMFKKNRVDIKRSLETNSWCFWRGNDLELEQRGGPAFLLPRTVTAVHVWGIKGYGRLMADQAAAPVFPYPYRGFRVFRSEERHAPDLGQALRDSISMPRPPRLRVTHIRSERWIMTIDHECTRAALRKLRSLRTRLSATKAPRILVQYFLKHTPQRFILVHVLCKNCAYAFPM